MINRLIPWEWAFKKRGKGVVFKIIANSLTSEDVEGFETLLRPSMLPFTPTTIDLHQGNEILYDSLSDPWNFLKENLFLGKAIIVNARRLATDHVPDYFRINISAKANKDLYRASISYHVDDSPSFRLIRNSLVNLFPAKNIVQAFFYAQDYFNLIHKRHYAHYKYKKGLETFVNDHNEKMVDITKRPGVSTQLKGGLFFRGAAEYWFGSDFFTIIPKEHIMAFPYAINIEEIKPGLVWVQLFESVFAGLSHDEVWVHQEFRKHLQVDELKLF